MKCTTEDYKVARPINRVKTHRTATGESYLDGVVITPLGMVDCYSQGGDGYSNYARMDFMLDGRCYMRTFNKRLSKVSLARMAMKFAKEIAA